MARARLPDLDLLLLFEAIYDTRSVTRAAEQLALSQSAASHALARLRDILKDDLFHRAAQTLTPTPVAAALYPEVRKSLESLRGALSEAQGFDPATSARRFHISIPHVLGPVIAMKVMDRVKAVAPRVEFVFDTRTMPADLPRDLAEGLSDLALDWLPIDKPDYVNKLAFNDAVCLIAHRDHPRLADKPTLEALLAERAIRIHHRRPPELMPDWARQATAPPWQSALVVSEFMEIPAIVAMTDFIGPMSRSAAHVLERIFPIRTIAFPVGLPPMEVYLIWHASRRRDVAHRWLREVVQAEALAVSR